MEKNVDRVVNCNFLVKQSNEQLNQDLIDHLSVIENSINSPRLMSIMRNAILTLLETPNQAFSWKAVRTLLTDDEFRGSVVKRLKQVTPTFWLEGWNDLCKESENPSLSRGQPRIVKRHSLIVYWTEEWDAVPQKERIRTAQLIEAL